MDFDDIVGPDETIKATVRRHWISALPPLGSFLVLALATIYGFYLLGRFSDQLPGSPWLVGLGLLAMLVLSLLLGYTSWMVYRNNHLVITDKNLYQITRNSLFNQTVSQFSLDRLQDVSASQKGLLASMLNYGDVSAETAGHEENFMFRQAPHPKRLGALIMRYHKEAAGEAAPRHDGL